MQQKNQDGTDKKIRKGVRVRTTGFGRTATWGKCEGTVSMKRDDSVFVYWDGTSFEDQMDLNEVEAI